MWILSVIAALTYLLSGCEGGKKAIVPRELVLKKGEAIEFTNSYGSVRVEAVEELERRIVVNNEDLGVIELIPREKRFLGMLGGYNPGERWSFEDQSRPRIVFVEAERPFRSMADAKKKLIEGSAVMDWAVGQEGYVCGFGGLVRARNEVTIKIFKFLVDGRAPEDFRDPEDREIRFYGGTELP